MSFDYIDPTASDKDEVRFLIGDVSVSEPQLQDEDINYLLAKWGPLYNSNVYVASIAADAIAAKYAREAPFAADGVSINLAAVAQQYRDLAASLRQQFQNSLVGGQPDVGGISPCEGQKKFGTGMHDNPEAGRQDYGDWQNYIYDGYYDWYNMPGA